MSASDPVWCNAQYGALADCPAANMESLGRFYRVTDATPNYTLQCWTSGTSYAWVNVDSGDARPVYRVRGASTANVSNLAACSTTMDGLTLVANDRVLLKNQSTGSQNGIYVVGTVSGGAAPLTRAPDFDADAEVKSGSLVVVEAGTANADTVYELTTNATITVGTTSLTFSLTSVLDSLLCHLAGTETLTGNKTLSGSTTLSGAVAHTGSTLGLFSATPAAQPTAVADLGTSESFADAAAVTTYVNATLAPKINALLARLRTLGVIAT